MHTIARVPRHAQARCADGTEGRSPELAAPHVGRRRSRWLLDLDLLFDELLAARRPYSVAGLARGPEFRALATSSSGEELRVLAGLRDPDEVLAAVRVSSHVPLLSGEPPLFRGEPLVDGGFLESLPFRTALNEGATHVLVLRSREAGFRMGAYSRLTELAVRRRNPQLLALVRSRPERYNQEAEELELLASRPSGRPPVTQVAVPPGSRLVGHLARDVGQIREGVRLGMAAMASTVLRDSVEPLEAAA